MNRAKRIGIGFGWTLLFYLLGSLLGGATVAIVGVLYASALVYTLPLLGAIIIVVAVLYGLYRARRL